MSLKKKHKNFFINVDSIKLFFTKQIVKMKAVSHVLMKLCL